METILVLNGSPRKRGHITRGIDLAVAHIIQKCTKKGEEVQVIRHNVNDLNFQSCCGCMSCREKISCAYPRDDAHQVAKDFQLCDYLVVATPVYWGNMSGQLKRLFDRLVGVLMGESKYGVPLPLHKGKKAVIVTSCTTPFPFNYLCGQTTGARRAIKEILKTSGFKVIFKISFAGTKKNRNLLK